MMTDGCPDEQKKIVQSIGQPYLSMMIVFHHLKRKMKRCIRKKNISKIVDLFFDLPIKTVHYIFYKQQQQQQQIDRYDDHKPPPPVIML